jgi:N-acetylneuraminic acid mutarotase
MRYQDTSKIGWTQLWLFCFLGTVFFWAWFAETATADVTFNERVQYERQIEAVNWRHTLWPKENETVKPALEEVLPEETLINRVEDTLRMSKALEALWDDPIRGADLQTEIDRMAQTTRMPERLRELWEALGNDPQVIAECLARPLLVERLIRGWYAYDERFHGELNERVDAEVSGHREIEDLKGMASGEYREWELVREQPSGGKSKRKSESGKIVLSDEDWNTELKRLAGIFRVKGEKQELPTGIVSAVQESEEKFYIIEVLEKSPDRLKLATIGWPKVEFDEWWDSEKGRFTPEVEEEEAFAYSLPEISAQLPNALTAKTPPIPEPRMYHTAVWTGSQMIVWGGRSNWERLNTGGRYNPSTNSWQATSTTNAPTARSSHEAVWTGNQMIVWGGYGGAYNDENDGTFFNTGGRYNPSTNKWQATSAVNAPAARSAHKAVWTGSLMIVWGGYDGSHLLNTGGRYNPSTNKWQATSTANAPAGRNGHTAVWTGSQMIIWGGYNYDVGGYLKTGGLYNPSTNRWQATSTANAPAGRNEHPAVWTGSQMIIWGGYNYDVGGYLKTGGLYNPSTNRWQATSTASAPTGRSRHSAVWTGSQMIVWGGSGGDLNTGGRYNPSTNKWQAISTTNAPTGREGHKAVWTGREMIIWGGAMADVGCLNTGGRYNPSTNSWQATSTGPSTNSWQATSTANAPTGRSSHTAVWTGSVMIVWGGATDGRNYSSTGGRYNPATNSWQPTNTTNAPAGRESHTAVWTGSEMIVWGGCQYHQNIGYEFLNTGGRYNPSINNWQATTNAPSARAGHTAVWTGSQMIVWGGSNASGYLNSGSRYNPSTRSWQATNTANAPAARSWHTAVWTGSQMIVWGGLADDELDTVNTGGRYNPTTNSWLATSTANAPNGRFGHTAVWTGSEMIVWGGDLYDVDPVETGGRYSPATNSWRATSTSNAPTARMDHTAVWTGSVMIVWGGFTEEHDYTNTGGRYNPSSNNWQATSTANAPTAREDHTAVWTGSEMIVWGGFDNTGCRYRP